MLGEPRTVRVYMHNINPCCCCSDIHACNVLILRSEQVLYVGSNERSYVTICYVCAACIDRVTQCYAQVVVLGAILYLCSMHVLRSDAVLQVDICVEQCGLVQAQCMVRNTTRTPQKAGLPQKGSSTGSLPA